MDATRRRFLIILIVGGAAVLGSYAHGLATQPEPRPAPAWRALALLGSVLFAFPTFLLDALVWPAYFPV